MTDQESQSLSNKDSNSHFRRNLGFVLLGVSSLALLLAWTMSPDLVAEVLELLVSVPPRLGDILSLVALTRIIPKLARGKSDLKLGYFALVSFLVFGAWGKPLGAGQGLQGWSYLATVGIPICVVGWFLWKFDCSRFSESSSKQPAPMRLLVKFLTALLLLAGLLMSPYLRRL